jgi:hypothetical protein
MQLHSFLTPELDGYLDTLAALPSGDEALLPFEHEAGWVPEPVWMFWRGMILLLMGIRPWIMQPIALSLHQLC